MDTAAFPVKDARLVSGYTTTSRDTA